MSGIPFHFSALMLILWKEVTMKTAIADPSQEGIRVRLEQPRLVAVMSSPTDLAELPAGTYGLQPMPCPYPGSKKGEVWWVCGHNGIPVGMSEATWRLWSQNFVTTGVKILSK